MSRKIGRHILQILPGTADRFPAVNSMLAIGSTSFHLNESPFPPSRCVQNAIAEAITGLNRYPSPHPEHLVAELADRNAVPKNTVLIGPGSDDLLSTIALTFIEPGDEAIVPVPSFGKYQSATLVAGGTPLPVQLLPRGEVDLIGMLNRITPRTRLIFVPSPNNPTGGSVSIEALTVFMAALPEWVVPVFDLAYHEFAVRSGAVDILQLLVSLERPWICVRTMSKAYCLAGIRLGYAICSDQEHQSALLKIRSVFNVSALSIVAALAALRDQAYLRQIVDCIVAQRRALQEIFLAQGFDVLPSHANFLAVNIGVSREKVVESMKARGLHLAKILHPDYSGYVRITAGTHEENCRLAAMTSEFSYPKPIKSIDSLMQSGGHA